jgi:hypothetical protein
MLVSAGVIPLFLVAQQAAGTPSRQWTMADSVKVVALIGGLIVLVLILGAILLGVRRRMLAAGSSRDAAGQMMEELRRMRSRGGMTPEEYDAARSAATRRLTANQPQAPTAPARRAPPARPGELRAQPGFDLTGDPLPPADAG